MTEAPAQPDIPHDKAEQLAKVQSGLMEGEQLLAVYDCIGTGTGFLAMTDRRVILQDHSFVGKKVGLTSVPYTSVDSVSLVSNKSMMGSFFDSGNVALWVKGRTYLAEFRGTEKAAHVHNVVLHYLTVGAK